MPGHPSRTQHAKLQHARAQICTTGRAGAGPAQVFPTLWYERRLAHATAKLQRPACAPLFDSLFLSLSPLSFSLALPLLLYVSHPHSHSDTISLSLTSEAAAKQFHNLPVQVRAMARARDGPNWSSHAQRQQGFVPLSPSLSFTLSPCTPCTASEAAATELRGLPVLAVVAALVRGQRQLPGKTPNALPLELGQAS